MAKKKPEESLESAGDLTAPLQRFEVSLKHHPARVVEAVDEAAAFQAYCGQFGILSSDHQPKILCLDAPEPDPE